MDYRIKLIYYIYFGWAGFGDPNYYKDSCVLKVFLGSIDEGFSCTTKKEAIDIIIKELMDESSS